jgi:hypothetical protein
MTSPRGETLYEFGEQLDYESIQSVAVVNDVSAYHKVLSPTMWSTLPNKLSITLS